MTPCKSRLVKGRRVPIKKKNIDREIRKKYIEGQKLLEKMLGIRKRGKI